MYRLPRLLPRAWSRQYHSVRSPTPLSLPLSNPSLLPLVLSSSNLLLTPPLRSPGPHFVSTRTDDGSSTHSELVVPFYLSHNACHTSQTSPIGYIRETVSQALQENHLTHLQENSTSPWDFRHAPSGDLVSISFSSPVNQGGSSSRTSHIDDVVRRWKDKRIFDDILRGWRKERYPVFEHTSRETFRLPNSIAFAIDRAALPLFGLPNFGCLLIAFYRSQCTNKTMIWVPRRSMTKRTWPGKLDVTVGGGIGLGDTALSSIVRECSEEALLDPKYVLENVRSAGVLPFPNRSPAGWILPGLYYLYDLPLKSDGSIVPRTNAADGEVESFELMDVESVLENLLQGSFKASSALAMIDFLIRNGFISEDSDIKFADVCRLLKRDVKLSVP